jgi:acyl carrier protein
MNMMAVTYEGLRHFLSDELAIDTPSLTSETLLFSSGLVDSFAFVSLLAYLEAEGDVQIEPTDVNLDNFDSIERILAYLHGAQASAS